MYTCIPGPSHHVVAAGVEHCDGKSADDWKWRGSVTLPVDLNVLKGGKFSLVATHEYHDNDNFGYTIMARLEFPSGAAPVLTLVAMELRQVPEPGGPHVYWAILLPYDCV